MWAIVGCSWLHVGPLLVDTVVARVPAAAAAVCVYVCSVYAPVCMCVHVCKNWLS